MGWLPVGQSRVAKISSNLGMTDHLGAWKVRWGIGRMQYLVPAGLYAIGTPGPQDPVVVTANFKMSFDLVRRSLAGRSIWLLVLETFGINVWCAAGKGSFGTDELVARIGATGLAGIVTHRKLLLPILGAPGVAAHEVAKRTGFTVSYAAIRAENLPEYLDNGKVTTPAMREMTFSFRERLSLIPVELVLALKPTAGVGLLLFMVLTALGGIAAGLTSLLAYFGAVLAGIVMGPLLLPWIPGRSFAVKGALAGLLWCGGLFLFGNGATWGLLPSLAALLALPAISAFYTLNFTGCTPFASRSGVKEEMRLSFPAMGGALLVSALLLLAKKLS
jgi:acetyl-CoA decarbonylase/synthase complex subunit gamma